MTNTSSEPHRICCNRGLLHFIKPCRWSSLTISVNKRSKKSSNACLLFWLKFVKDAAAALFVMCCWKCGVSIKGMHFFLWCPHFHPYHFENCYSCFKLGNSALNEECCVIELRNDSIPSHIFPNLPFSYNFCFILLIARLVSKSARLAEGVGWPAAPILGKTLSCLCTGECFWL